MGKVVYCDFTKNKSQPEPQDPLNLLQEAIDDIEKMDKERLQQEEEYKKDKKFFKVFVGVGVTSLVILATIGLATK